MNAFHTRITDLLDAASIPYRWLMHGEPVFTVEAAARQRGVLIEEKDYVAMIAADGTWRWDANIKPDLAFVVQTGDLQTTLTPEEFTARYGSKGKSRAKPGARN